MNSRPAAPLHVMDAANLLIEGRDAEARAAAQDAVNSLNAVFWPYLVEGASNDTPER